MERFHWLCLECLGKFSILHLNYERLHLLSLSGSLSLSLTLSSIKYFWLYMLVTMILLIVNPLKFSTSGEAGNCIYVASKKSTDCLSFLPVYSLPPSPRLCIGFSHFTWGSCFTGWWRRFTLKWSEVNDNIESVLCCIVVLKKATQL